MLPDSAFNSVSVVKGKGSFKISFHIQTLLLLALLWNCCCCSCILRGNVHLCRQNTSLQLIPSHFPGAWHCENIAAQGVSHLYPYNFFFYPTKDLLLQKLSVW